MQLKANQIQLISEALVSEDQGLKVAIISNKCTDKNKSYLSKYFTRSHTAYRRDYCLALLEF